MREVVGSEGGDKPERKRDDSPGSRTSTKGQLFLTDKENLCVIFLTRCKHSLDTLQKRNRSKVQDEKPLSKIKI